MLEIVQRGDMPDFIRLFGRCSSIDCLVLDMDVYRHAKMLEQLLFSAIGDLIIQKLSLMGSQYFSSDRESQ